MQTFVPEQQIDSNGEPAMVQPASDLKPGRILHSKNWPESPYGPNAEKLK
jgi:hypothetical protein